MKPEFAFWIDCNEREVAEDVYKILGKDRVVSRTLDFSDFNNSSSLPDTILEVITDNEHLAEIITLKYPHIYTGQR